MALRWVASSLPLACLAIVVQLASVAHAIVRPPSCPTYANVTAGASFGAPPLPLPYDGYLPAIDNETMFLHYNRHAGGAVNNLNAVLARYPALKNISLAELVQKIGTNVFTTKYNLAANDVTALRNNAGSAYNHAIFWNIMTTYNTSTPAVLSAELANKIASTFGSPTAMLDQLRAAAGALFGSGWSWVVYRPTDGTLRIVSTPNQDNPVMKHYVPTTSQGVPLIGVDVWEHAYYLKYRNVRATYLSQWVNLVNWSKFQRNYEVGKTNSINSIYC